MKARMMLMKARPMQVHTKPKSVRTSPDQTIVAHFSVLIFSATRVRI